MAGIGFELRKILSADSFRATVHGYAYAGVIGSGPWVLSILAVLIVGIISVGIDGNDRAVQKFLVSVTYLMAVSLIFTGGTQLVFTRFVADRLFEHRHDCILPNLFGLLTLNTLASALLAAPIAFLAFPTETFAYQVLLLANFVALTNLWLVVIFLSGMKRYGHILGVMFIGYSLMVATGFGLRHLGTEGLMACFLLTHAGLLFAFLTEVVRIFPLRASIAFDFLNRSMIFPTLFAAGLIFYCGVWVDKFLFWYNPATSEGIVGPLRASAIYDMPIFIAYLTTIPGMAVFLLRIETDFAENYERLYDAIRGGAALDHVYFLKDQMSLSVRRAVMEIVKVQGVTVLVFFLWAEDLFRWLGISELFLPLLYVDVVGAGVQVILMALLNVFFYLDRRRSVIIVTLTFFLTNAIVTFLTQQLGPAFFGYGFVISALAAALVGLVILNRRVFDLEYETFMLT